MIFSAAIDGATAPDLAEDADLPALLDAASVLRDQGHGNRKVSVAKGKGCAWRLALRREANCSNPRSRAAPSPRTAAR